jgi:hypothetical protein
MLRNKFQEQELSHQLIPKYKRKQGDLKETCES